MSKQLWKTVSKINRIGQGFITYKTVATSRYPQKKLGWRHFRNLGVNVFYNFKNPFMIQLRNILYNWSGHRGETVLLKFKFWESSTKNIRLKCTYQCLNRQNKQKIDKNEKQNDEVKGHSNKLCRLW